MQEYHLYKLMVAEYLIKTILTFKRWEKLIVQDKNICGGCPTIKETRITVSVILSNIRDEIPFKDICIDYGITKEDIKECIDYAIWNLTE